MTKAGYAQLDTDNLSLPEIISEAKDDEEDFYEIEPWTGLPLRSRVTSFYNYVLD